MSIKKIYNQNKKSMTMNTINYFQKEIEIFHVGNEYVVQWKLSSFPYKHF